MDLQVTPMSVRMKAWPGWWMVALLSILNLAAADSDLRLVKAVERGDMEAVRSLLEQHVDVNASQADGATALHWAAHRDDQESAELLIDVGANVNAVNSYGITPLSLACTNGSAAMVKKLLEAGADPNTALLTGETVLMTAARTGNEEAVKALLLKGAEVNANETRRGQTALMWAVSENHLETVGVLVEHGADIHARSLSGFTPLMFAARENHMELARSLLEKGANVNDVTSDAMTPLLVASASGYEELSIFLLEQGGDPNAADEKGTTALHYAVQKGISSLTRLEESYYNSYLYRPNMLELVKALLAHGADPNPGLMEAVRFTGTTILTDLGRVTPFLLAAAVDDASVMRVLVAGGADPLMTTADHTTPLMAAAGLGRTSDRTVEEAKTALEAVKLAVELGADVNATNDRGQTALQGAARVGLNPLIQYLVDEGAKLDTKDIFGQTALSIASGVVPSTDLMAKNWNHKPFGVHQSSVNLLRELGATPLPASETVYAAPGK